MRVDIFVDLPYKSATLFGSRGGGLCAPFGSLVARPGQLTIIKKCITQGQSIFSRLICMNLQEVDSFFLSNNIQ